MQTKLQVIKTCTLSIGSTASHYSGKRDGSSRPNHNARGQKIILFFVTNSLGFQKRTTQQSVNLNNEEHADICKQHSTNEAEPCFLQLKTACMDLLIQDEFGERNQGQITVSLESQFQQSYILVFLIYVLICKWIFDNDLTN